MNKVRVLERQVTEAAEQRLDLQRVLEEARQGFEESTNSALWCGQQMKGTRADLRRALLDIDRK